MRYFTGFLIAIGLIVLLFVVILRSGGGPKQKQINLDSYASTGAVAQLTIDGPITADQTHQAVQIAVNANQTTFQVLQGYEGQVQTTKTFEANQASFSVFLHALNLAGFSQGNNASSVSDDRGYCPGGDRYIFELQQNGSDVFRYWATACGGQGSSKAQVSTVLSLFQAQVPDYDDLTGNVQI